MKKYLAGIIVALVVVAAVIFTSCSDGVASGPLAGDLRLINQQQEGIWVNGQGKVTVTPDVAILSLGVSAQSASVADAMSQASTAMDKVMNALKTNGIAVKDIQTQSFNVQQVTRWDDKGQTEIVIGYRVTNIIVAKVRALDKAGTIIDAVATAGGDLTRINSITFTVEDPTKYYQEAREKAMKDAKAKGEQLAGLAGVKLGTPIYINESSGYYPPVPMPVMRDSAAGMSVATPITPGELEINLNVQVNYAIR